MLVKILHRLYDNIPSCNTQTHSECIIVGCSSVNSENGTVLCKGR